MGAPTRTLASSAQCRNCSTCLTSTARWSYGMDFRPVALESAMCQRNGEFPRCHGATTNTCAFRSGSKGPENDCADFRDQCGPALVHACAGIRISRRAEGNHHDAWSTTHVPVQTTAVL